MSVSPHRCAAPTSFGTSLEPTIVFDSFWHFAAERQRIYFKRLRDEPPPWTNDRVIAEFKFTNAYRASDRVSQYLIRHVIYSPEDDYSPEDVLFRILLFKFFNKIETWQRLETAVGKICLRSFSVEGFSKVLAAAVEEGPIYSAAYIMPPASRFGYRRKHRNHLTLLDTMVRSSLCSKLARARSLRDVFELFKSFPSIGDFLAYQYTIDVNYSELIDFDEADFVVAGPGARDGIFKAFTGIGCQSEADVIHTTAARQDEEFAQRGLDFRSLFGRPLKPVDCQNLYCELAKYSRAAHPHIAGKSNRTRIKQRFAASGCLPRPWFPPKWRINDRVSAALGSEGA